MNAQTNQLLDTGAEIATVAERFGGAVVGVGRGWRVGWGAVVAPGTVLTAARHVDRDETTVTLADGTRAAGELGGVDRERGLAVLRVDTGDADPLALAAGFDGGIGTPVFALANPGGR